MTPAQRSMARQRFQQWRQLTPQQRQTLRNRWQKFRALPSQQQQAIRQSFREFQRLPPWRRRMLRQQWQHATPEQRQLMMQRLQIRRSRPMEQMPRLPMMRGRRGPRH
jgi:hypothetical protein